MWRIAYFCPIHYFRQTFMRYFSILFILSLIAIGASKNGEAIDTKVKLGKKLFFDKRLSKNNTISCATCHKPEFAFADTSPFSQGVYGRFGKRNTPSVMNMASREIFFFDGRAKNLEEQATFPIQDHNEMDILVDEAFQKIIQDPKYKQWFRSIYKSQPSKDNILNAIAEFERSLESTSPFDQYMNGDEKALTASQIRGHKLFTDPKNRCFQCHFSPDFTGDEFKNVGLFDGIKYNDSGRYLITKDINDLGKFKVPSLRNVAVTMPYMHDGSMKTLREVIRFYNDVHKVIPNPINADSLLQTPINLSENDISDIENFLISLTDPQYKKLIYAKYPHYRRRN